MEQKTTFTWIFIFLAFAVITGCNDEHSWNNPYPNIDDSNVFFTAFSERPKHLDPAKSYSSSEWAIISQIYEPPLQYHYLKRPYVLENLVSESTPKVFNIDANHTVWEIKIKPGIKYQPHPAFARDTNNKLIYHGLTEDELENYSNLSEFSNTATRELVAEDFVYQIKRIADPKLNSPIYGFLKKYIVGLENLRQNLQEIRNKDFNKILNLQDFIFSGAYVVDKYTYRVTIKGNYPQFQYWLAMPFFAPIPWEADLFYQQPGMSENNITLDWYPVGTGPYMLLENNPERRMVMVKNPNFHGELYPSYGEEADKSSELLLDKGKSIPFIDKVVYVLEKEDIPYWNKFLQGFFDISGISSDSFNSAIDTSPSGGLDLNQDLKSKGIKLQTTVAPTTMYWGFNMLDKTIGGYSDNNIKLRQAISIAFDVEEFISIFANGRGIAAQSPIPPGILGYDLTYNDFIYTEDKMDIPQLDIRKPKNKEEYDRAIKLQESFSSQKYSKKSIDYAKQLLVEAGYPAGRDKNTGEPLVINFEAISSGDPNEKAVFAWLRKQLDKIDIQLNIRVTDYNRFQDKMKNGSAQMYFWGWNADYPDPENFLFMFYGPNGKAEFGGENSSNYNNREFDKLFMQLKTTHNNVSKKALIIKMLKILQKDSAWIWGYHPETYSLQHFWVSNNKPSGIARNTLKYLKIDNEKREIAREKWNKPIYWPFILIILIVFLIILPAILVYRKKQQSYALRKQDKC